MPVNAAHMSVVYRQITGRLQAGDRQVTGRLQAGCRQVTGRLQAGYRQVIGRRRSTWISHVKLTMETVHLTTCIFGNQYANTRRRSMQACHERLYQKY